jgi:hypothetical protein
MKIAAATPLSPTLADVYENERVLNLAESALAISGFHKPSGITEIRFLLIFLGPPQKKMTALDSATTSAVCSTGFSPWRMREPRTADPQLAFRISS